MVTVAREDQKLKDSSGSQSMSALLRSVDNHRSNLRSIWSSGLRGFFGGSAPEHKLTTGPEATATVDLLLGLELSNKETAREPTKRPQNPALTAPDLLVRTSQSELVLKQAEAVNLREVLLIDQEWEELASQGASKQRPTVARQSTGRDRKKQLVTSSAHASRPIPNRQRQKAESDKAEIFELLDELEASASLPQQTVTEDKQQRHKAADESEIFDLLDELEASALGAADVLRAEAIYEDLPKDTAANEIFDLFDRLEAEHREITLMGSPRPSNLDPPREPPKTSNGKKQARVSFADERWKAKAVEYELRASRADQSTGPTVDAEAKVSEAPVNAVRIQPSTDAVQSPPVSAISARGPWVLEESSENLIDSSFQMADCPPPTDVLMPRGGTAPWSPAKALQWNLGSTIGFPPASHTQPTVGFPWVEQSLVVPEHLQPPLPPSQERSPVAWQDVSIPFLLDRSLQDSTIHGSLQTFDPNTPRMQLEFEPSQKMPRTSAQRQERLPASVPEDISQPPAPLPSPRAARSYTPDPVQSTGWSALKSSVLKWFKKHCCLPASSSPQDARSSRTIAANSRPAPHAVGSGLMATTQPAVVPEPNELSLSTAAAIDRDTPRGTLQPLPMSNLVSTMNVSDLRGGQLTEAVKPQQATSMAQSEAHGTTPQLNVVESELTSGDPASSLGPWAERVWQPEVVEQWRIQSRVTASDTAPPELDSPGDPQPSPNLQDLVSGVLPAVGPVDDSQPVLPVPPHNQTAALGVALLQNSPVLAGNNTPGTADSPFVLRRLQHSGGTVPSGGGESLSPRSAFVPRRRLSQVDAFPSARGPDSVNPPMSTGPRGAIPVDLEATLDNPESSTTAARWHVINERPGPEQRELMRKQGTPGPARIWT